MRIRRFRVEGEASSGHGQAMRPFFAIALTALVLGGCAAPRPAPVPPPIVVALPRPVPPTPAPLAADWNDWPFTPGEWVYRRSNVGALAMFGVAQIVLRCDFAQRTVLLKVDGGRSTIMIRTTAMARTIALDGEGGTMLAPTDPLLDAMAFSRGRVVVERTGQPPLVVPPQAEIGRVIEDCRG